MSSFFNADNKFFTFMGKVFDLLVLSLLWLVLCIPVITIGPASTAFYYTMVKVIRRERSYLFKEFFRSFKLNFKQGIVLSLVYVAFALLMYFDLTYAMQLTAEGTGYGSVLYGVFLAIGIFAVFTMIYAFPLLSRFTVSTKHLFKWSFLLSVRHIGWTLVMVLLLACTVIIMAFSLFSVPLLFIFLPGIYTLVLSFPMERVLKKYMPKEEDTDEEDGTDRWYNE